MLACTVYGKTITGESFRNRPLQVAKFAMLTHLGLSLKYAWILDLEPLVSYRFNEIWRKVTA
jgi:hypothetical protein